MKRSISLLAVLTVVAANVAPAQITYNGGTYSESFSSIYNVDGQGTAVPGTAGTGVQGAVPTLTTWQAARITGTGTTTFAIFADWGGSGASSPGRLYSYGLPGSSERALGALAGAATTVGFGTWFVNNSSDTFNSVTFSFDREIWRNQNTAADQSLSFSYGFASIGILPGNFITNTLMTAYPALNATSPSFYASLNGGVSGFTDPSTNMVPVSATISGLNWAPGDSLFIRWNDTDNTGTDAGIAIDNLSMVATVPEPSGGLMLGLGFAALALLRRVPAKVSLARAGMKPLQCCSGCVKVPDRNPVVGFRGQP